MMTEQSIERYEEAGFKRWTKNGMDRLYVDAKVLGLECTYYKSGNVSTARFNGNSISNRDARRLMGAKTYIDVKDGTLHSTRDDLKAATEALMAGID